MVERAAGAMFGGAPGGDIRSETPCDPPRGEHDDRRRRRSRFTAGVGVGLMGAASLTTAVYQTITQSSTTVSLPGEVAEVDTPLPWGAATAVPAGAPPSSATITPTVADLALRADQQPLPGTAAPPAPGSPALGVPTTGGPLAGVPGPDTAGPPPRVDRPTSPTGTGTPSGTPSGTAGSTPSSTTPPSSETSDTSAPPSSTPEPSSPGSSTPESSSPEPSSPPSSEPSSPGPSSQEPTSSAPEGGSTPPSSGAAEG
ncbi:hypothetical protein ACR9E3_18490 [Actinomycetospora sp. C-140]